MCFNVFHIFEKKARAMHVKAIQNVFAAVFGLQAIAMIECTLRMMFRSLRWGSIFPIFSD